MDGDQQQRQLQQVERRIFASVWPRQDAVEAVTVTMAAGGANVGGTAPSDQLRDPPGHNRFSGSAYEYFRHTVFNTNNWSTSATAAEDDVQLNQFGARQGGPIVIPGLYDGRGKAFFFVHYEQLRLPNSYTGRERFFNPAGSTGCSATTDRWRRAGGPRGQRARPRPGERADRHDRSGRDADCLNDPRGHPETGSLTPRPIRGWSATPGTARPSRSSTSPRSGSTTTWATIIA